MGRDVLDDDDGRQRRREAVHDVGNSVRAARRSADGDEVDFRRGLDGGREHDMRYFVDGCRVLHRGLPSECCEVLLGLGILALRRLCGYFFRRGWLRHLDAEGGGRHGRFRQVDAMRRRGRLCRGRRLFCLGGLFVDQRLRQEDEPIEEAYDFTAEWRPVRVRRRTQEECFGTGRHCRRAQDFAEAVGDDGNAGCAHEPRDEPLAVDADD